MVRQAVTLVGRDAECHLVLPDDDQLAPRHARFEERGTGVFLSSLTPERPVECNGRPVLDAVRLAHNDLLVVGQTRIQFQDVIAAPPALVRPSPGILQPLTGLMVAAILALELVLLLFLVDWPTRIIRPETEMADLARAEKIRDAAKTEKTAETGTTARATVPASVISMPGTETAAPSTNGAAAETSPSGPTVTSPPPAVLEVLGEADFKPADTNTPLADLPPISAADPRIEEAQRQLAEAVSAAQFADFAQAFRLLNQIHQNAPGFLPAHVEHARLLEARGDLDAAQERWTQIQGIAAAGSPVHEQAVAEHKRLERIQALQTQILQSPGSSGSDHLPRNIRIVAPDIQKMPADAAIAEMRVLNATLELDPDEHLFQKAAIQVFITFYDSDANGQVQASRAITTSSPLVLGSAFADRRSLPIEATYVVPRGLRAQEERETGRQTTYYGYTIHLFAGQILQDSFAKPKKLLDLPIHISTSEN